MATRRYGVNPGGATFDVLEAVGAATSSRGIELTVDLAVLTDVSGMGKEAVLVGLQKIQDWITIGNWPPA